MSRGPTKKEIERMKQERTDMILNIAAACCVIAIVYVIPFLTGVNP